MEFHSAQKNNPLNQWPMDPTFIPPREMLQPSDLQGNPLYPSGKVIHRRFWRGQTIDVVDEEGGMRSLYFMSRLIQSRMDLSDPIRLVLPYSRHMMASLIFLQNKDTPRVLMIGLGGGSLVRFILHHLPGCRLDVVEVDDGMEVLTRSFFGLPDHPGLKIHVADGAIFLQTMTGVHYDLILVDAFDHQGMARTVYARQFFMAAKKWLIPTGIIAINLTKSDSMVYNSSVKILKTLFPVGFLRLPVRGSRNEIFLCFPETAPRTDWTQAEKQAKTWEQETAMEFGQFLQDMRRFSSPFWSRGINF